MRVTLLCLPFAGGNKHSLRFLKDNLPRDIAFHSLEYPGHGSRIKEQALTDIHKVVEDVYLQIKPLLNEPYAIYGHSFGAMVAYLLTKKIQNSNMPEPLHLFVSGLDAPSVTGRRQPYYLLPKEEFISKVRQLGGLPDEILNDAEMIDFFEPSLRADFQAFETYHYEHNDHPVNIPVTVMTGESENLKKENIMRWQTETVQDVRFFRFPGGHFFIYDYPREITDIICGSLMHTVS
jgi:surfactin synthase thioesterase subunit